MHLKHAASEKVCGRLSLGASWAVQLFRDRLSFQQSERNSDVGTVAHTLSAQGEKQHSDGQDCHNTLSGMYHGAFESLCSPGLGPAVEALLS